MYTLATIETAKKLVLSKFPNLNMDALSIEELVNLAKTLDPSFTPGKPLCTCEKVDEALGKGPTEALKVAVEKQDRVISFGRDGVSFISFKESDLEGNEDAILLAKCMKILMVEYRKTSVDAANILLGRVSGNYSVYVSWCGGWGKFFLRVATHPHFTKGSGYISDAVIRIRGFISNETVRNAHNLINLKEILASMSL